MGIYRNILQVHTQESWTDNIQANTNKNFTKSISRKIGNYFTDSIIALNNVPYVHSRNKNLRENDIN